MDETPNISSETPAYLSDPEPRVKTDRASDASRLSRVLITLMQGVIYREEDATLWQDLVHTRAQVQSHAAVLRLGLVLSENDGCAFLQALPEDPDVAFPRLVARHQLSFTVSIMLALLRRHLTNADAGDSGTRVIMRRADIENELKVFLPDVTDEAKLTKRIRSAMTQIESMGFVCAVKGSDGDVEIRRVIGSFVDAQWLGQLAERLAEYHDRAIEFMGEDGESVRPAKPAAASLPIAADLVDDKTLPLFDSETA